MHRRSVLAALAGTGAGCLDGLPDRDRQSPDGTATTEGGREYRITDLSVTTRTERPSVTHVLEPTAFYSADAVERERADEDEPVVVRNVSEIADPAIREAVRTALADDQWRSNDPPDGLAETVRRVDFFTGVSEGDYTHVGLTLYRFHPNRPPPVEFDASVADRTVSEGSTGAIELALSNTGQRTQEVFSGTVPPFGTVFADAADDDGRFLLWRDYEEEGCVTFTDDGIAACAVGKLTELDPGETVSRAYEVLPSSTTTHPEYTAPPGPGRYRITDQFGYSHEHGGPGSTLVAEVSFTLG